MFNIYQLTLLLVCHKLYCTMYQKLFQAVQPMVTDVLEIELPLEYLHSKNILLHQNIPNWLRFE